MPVPALPPSQPVIQKEAVAHSPAAVPEWWPLAQSGTFVPMEREQCWEYLGRSGAGWLSRPGAVSTSRQSTTYAVTGNELTLEPQPDQVLPIGQIVLFQVDHFDPEQRTAWSIALVGRTGASPPESNLCANAAVPRVFLPLASTGVFGLTLAAEVHPPSRSDDRGLQGRSVSGSLRGLSSSRA